MLGKVIRMPHLYTDLKTPWGNIAAVMRLEDETLVAAAFGNFSDLVAKAGHQLSHKPIKKVNRIPLLAQVTTDWIDGDAQAFSNLNVEQAGGEFSQSCWRAMRTIPYGEVITYRELASMAQSPKAVRAAGSACANNLIAPYVPCHRIVKSGGALGNYGFGSELKYELLVHEGVEF